MTEELKQAATRAVVAIDALITLNIRRDDPQLSGTVMGYAESTSAELLRALAQQEAQAVEALERCAKWCDEQARSDWWGRKASDMVRAFASLPTQPAAQVGEREAFEAAMKDSWQMVDPLRPPTAGSYYAGEHAGICAALKTVRANFERHWQARASLPTQQATPEPVPAEQAKWCEFVAGMVDCWVSAEWSNYHHKDKDRRVKAIAGIIERRLWALQKQQSATPEPLHLFEFWWESHMPQATQSQAWAAWAAAQNSKGATIDAAQATPEPVGEVAEGEFFAWDAEGGIAFYKTQQEAIDHAKESLKYYLDGANDHGEWDEDVEQIRWGVVMQRAKAVNISAAEDGEGSCDYELQDLATRPAPGVPEGYDSGTLTGSRVTLCFESQDAALVWFDHLCDAYDALAAAQAKGGAA